MILAATLRFVVDRIVHRCGDADPVALLHEE